jgi:hypothetical protein
MASSIPKEVMKVVTDGWLAETTWKVALFTSASNCMTQSTYAACTNEVSGTGYTTGGATLAGRSSAYDGTSMFALLDATNSAWATSTFTARYAIVYDTTSGLIRGRYDFLVDKVVSDGTLTVTWNTSGLIKVA